MIQMIIIQPLVARDHGFGFLKYILYLMLDQAQIENPFVSNKICPENKIQCMRIYT